MGTVKRAFLYVTRKKGKSSLLFFVLLIMATFVLSGLSIEKASQEEQRSLRQSLGGFFTISPDYSENNPYYKKMSDGDGGYTLHTERPLTLEVIDAVTRIDGIKKYDASTPTLVSTNLEVFPGNVPMKDRYNDLVYARTVPGTENNSFFESGTVKLIEGSHITPEGDNVAVISKDLAEKNNLKLGDTISLCSAGTYAEANVTVIGIYEILIPDSPLKNIVTYGRLYVAHPADYIARMIDRTPVTVRNAINALEEMGLVKRRLTSHKTPDHIYVKLPKGEDGK